MSDDIGKLVPIEMYARVLNRAERAEASHEQQVIVAANYAERAEAELKAVRAAVSFYADERNWHTPPHCYSAAVSDCGTKARAALDHSQGEEG